MSMYSVLQFYRASGLLTLQGGLRLLIHIRQCELPEHERM